MRLLDGKKTANKIITELKKEVKILKSNKVTPGLAVIIVGENEASKIYVSRKKKTCLEIGIKSFSFELPGNTKEDELLALIDKLNSRKDIHGILAQLPLPKQINENKILSRIDPKKDVDGFHPVNLGNLMAGRKKFVPATPAGIIELLKRYHIKIVGKHCVVVDRSNIVGKPIALMLLEENGTVTICHSRTNNLKEITRQADILVVAVGKPKMVTADMVKPWATIIDVGINRLDDGKLVGDVDFNAIKNTATAITPVPGGVGPMTIASLMKNCLQAAREQTQN